MGTFFGHVQLTWYYYHDQRSCSSGTVLVIVPDCYMYHPQMKFAKVMFLHLSVSHSVDRRGLHPEAGSASGGLCIWGVCI